MYSNTVENGEMDWNEVKSCEHPSESYEIFLTKFLSIYDDFFPN